MVAVKRGRDEVDDNTVILVSIDGEIVVVTTSWRERDDVASTLTASFMKVIEEDRISCSYIRVIQERGSGRERMEEGI